MSWDSLLTTLVLPIYSADRGERPGWPLQRRVRPDRCGG